MNSPKTTKLVLFSSFLIALVLFILTSCQAGKDISTSKALPAPTRTDLPPLHQNLSREDSLMPFGTASTPTSDHHTHLLSPATIRFLASFDAVPADSEPFMADALIEAMNQANIKCGMVASTGYFFASPLLPEPLNDEREKLQQENDWVIAEVARHPGRLVAFCGINPLRDYAEEEIARCALKPETAGIKIHFANSGVDVFNEVHRDRLIRVFNAAADHGLAVLVHTRTSEKEYGADHAQAFIKYVLAAAPRTVVQIPHLAGSGPGYDSDAAFEVYAEAAAAGDERMANVWFDVATSITANTKQETLDQVANQLRTFGLNRILFGSDYAGLMNQTPSSAWADFMRLPLSTEEFSTVAANLAPYMRGHCKEASSRGSK